MTDKHEDFAHGHAIMLGIFIALVAYNLSGTAYYIAIGTITVLKVLYDLFRFF